jgi:nanoRNase/pAp phosphatase (c-di-AMP/oligoRNAs hydrolase)
MNDLSSAANLIEKSQNILILPALESQGDELGASFGLFLTLKKMGKNVNLLTSKIPDKFQFLNELVDNASKDFTISIDTQNKEISEMRYEKSEQNLKIYLTLNKGHINPKDIIFTPTLPKAPDLLIALGASSLDKTSDMFSKNTQLFYKTPVINIDNNTENENFGDVNLITSNASITESVVELLNSIDQGENIMNSETATSLLTGIVWFYQNFRNSRTKPETFEMAARLIGQGADHQKIVQYLYKQKDVSQIKLLGKLLENLEYNENKAVYCSSLKETDFKTAGATPKDLVPVMEEIKFNFRYLPNLLVLWESHASPITIKGLIYSPQGNLIQKLLENFEGSAKKEGAIFLTRESNLNLAKEKVLKALN